MKKILFIDQNETKDKAKNACVYIYVANGNDPEGSEEMEVYKTVIEIGKELFEGMRNDEFVRK